MVSFRGCSLFRGKGLLLRQQPNTIDPLGWSRLVSYPSVWRAIERPRSHYSQRLKFINTLIKGHLDLQRLENLREHVTMSVEVSLSRFFEAGKLVRISKLLAVENLLWWGNERTCMKLDFHEEFELDCLGARFSDMVDAADGDSCRWIGTNHTTLQAWFPQKIWLCLKIPQNSPFKWENDNKLSDFEVPYFQTNPWMSTS